LVFDISGVTEAAAGDPLVAVLGLFVLGGLATQLLFRRYPIGRAIVRVVFLILLTFAFVRAGIAPYQPLQSTGMAFRDVVHGVLKIAWWAWAAWFVVGVLRAIVIIERLPRETKLLQDLLAGLIYLAAAFVVIAYVLDLPVRGLLATSGVLAIILGLALQSTLSDVFSGVVLSFSRPYAPGDWINIDGGTEGRVIEMNWRATHVLTGRRDLAIVPNSTIAKSKIVNASSPSGIHGTTVTLQLAGSTPPSISSEIIKNAILNCRLIVAAPSPTVLVKSISATCTEFEVTFFIEELASSTNAQNQFFDLAFRHLAVSGIRLASAQNQSATETLLDIVAIFATLSPEERRSIGAKLRPASYGQGETLLEPGQVLGSLFVIGAGVLSATREVADGEIEIERLGPADHFGEIGMLTGSPSIAKIVALTPVTVYELAKEDLAPICEARPQVAHELGRVLARRQAAGGLTSSPELDETMPASRLTAWFSERLHRLHDLAKAK
jgi:small-conductance mechanosensitive channel